MKGIFERSLVLLSSFCDEEVRVLGYYLMGSHSNRHPSMFHGWPYFIYIWLGVDRSLYLNGVDYTGIVLHQSCYRKISVDTNWFEHNLTWRKNPTLYNQTQSKLFAICSVFEVNFFEKCWIILWWFQTVSTLTVEVGLAVGSRKCTQGAKLFEVLSFTPENSHWMLQTVFNSSTLTKLIWFPAQVLFLYNTLLKK